MSCDPGIFLLLKAMIKEDEGHEIEDETGGDDKGTLFR